MKWREWRCDDVDAARKASRHSELSAERLVRSGDQNDGRPSILLRKPSDGLRLTASGERIGVKAHNRHSTNDWEAFVGSRFFDNGRLHQECRTPFSSKRNRCGVPITRPSKLDDGIHPGRRPIEIRPNQVAGRCGHCQEQEDHERDEDLAPPAPGTEPSAIGLPHSPTQPPRSHSPSYLQQAITQSTAQSPWLRFSAALTDDATDAASSVPIGRLMLAERRVRAPGRRRRR